MPSGYAVAIVIGVYPFLISWFFNRCMMERERRASQLIDSELDDLARSNPKFGEQLASIDTQRNPELLAAVKCVLRPPRRARGWLPLLLEIIMADRGSNLKELVERLRAPLPTVPVRRASIELALWTITVFLVTLFLGLWPVVTGGGSLLRELGLLWVSREQAQEAGRIFLCGGTITFLCGAASLFILPHAYRPIRGTMQRLQDLVSAHAGGTASSADPK